MSLPYEALSCHVQRLCSANLWKDRRGRSQSALLTGSNNIPEIFGLMLSKR